ncbi:hypothetical protein H1R20_g4639, partial [Candolleomyces eurysporus]
MAPHTSDDLRYRIIHWHHQYCLSPEEISILAGCSVRTVYCVLAYFRDYHNIRNPFARRRGRKRALSSTDVDFIASMIDARPKIFLDELQEDLANYRDIDVSIATLSRTLHRIAISKKKVSSSAAERNELLRAMWQAEYAHYPAEYFVWLDESSVDDFTNLRMDGWASLGRACVSCETFIRGQRYSVLPALTTDGILALDIFEGSVNKERFISFIRNDIAHEVLSCLTTAQFTMIKKSARSSKLNVRQNLYTYPHTPPTSIQLNRLFIQSSHGYGAMKLKPPMLLFGHG